MLIRFKVANTEHKSVWINPDHVSGVLGNAADVATIYLVGGVEQRVEALPDDVAQEIDSAQRRLAGVQGPAKAT
ncbi:MAG TPA: hypothetical protein VH414_21900 [Lichenihabitans sp.]|jgi:hypothetical protein|nr:hypothetical protein [Lichenihabitans sp.]